MQLISNPCDIFKNTIKIPGYRYLVNRRINLARFNSESFAKQRKVSGNRIGTGMQPRKVRNINAVFNRLNQRVVRNTSGPNEKICRPD